MRRELFGAIKNPWDQPDYPAGIRGKTFKMKLIQCGKEYEIPVSADEPEKLVAAERAGIRCRNAARSGECGWCRSRLLSGSVYVPARTDGRRRADVAFGYIHPLRQLCHVGFVLDAERHAPVKRAAGICRNCPPEISGDIFVRVAFGAFCRKRGKETLAAMGRTRYDMGSK